MAVPGGSVLKSDEGAWIHTRRFDLVFLTLSGVLVFLPYLSYGLLQRLGASPATASLLIGLGVTLLVGGPHMYSTYLRTALEPRFRARHRFLVYLPLIVIPALVIVGALHAFIFLLTFFFFWASVHVTHQAQFISESYRRKAGSRMQVACSNPKPAAPEDGATGGPAIPPGAQLRLVEPRHPRAPVFVELPAAARA